MKLFVPVLLILFALFSCADKNDSFDKETLRIATAANMQFAIDSIAMLFEKEHGIHCEIQPNSSGMLTAQIEKGAPYDVFVSANMRYPNRLNKSGFGERPEVYAYGRLILVFDKKLAFDSIEDLLNSDQIARVALADSKTAPYGMAASEYLENTGMKSKLKDKIVYGESIGQVNQYVTTGSVDAAFTSYSFITKFGKDFNFIEVDQKHFAKIKQGMLILKHGRKNKPEASEKFIEFLKTEKCQKVLEHFGYKVN